MKHTFILSLISGLLLFSITLRAQSEKKILDHTVYEDWKTLNAQQISKNGRWIAYEINPQKGDGTLHLYNADSKFETSFPRAYKASFSPTNDYIVFHIKPQYDTLRTMRLDKVKESKLPKDTLAIYLFDQDSTIKFPDVKSFSISEEGSPWIVYETHKQKPEYEEVKEEESKSWWQEFLKRNKKGDKPAKTEAKTSFNYVFNPLSGKEYEFYNITDYDFSHFGTQLALLKESKDDSLNFANLYLFDLKTEDTATVFKDRGTFGKFSFDRAGTQLAFTFSADTAEKNKVYTLYYSQIKDSLFNEVVGANDEGLHKGYSPSKHGRLYFSRDGRKLFFGAALTPKQEPKDSLLDSEKYSVDVWNYKDGQLQTQQVKRLPYERRKTYLSVYRPMSKQAIQLEDSFMTDVSFINFKNSTFALGSTQAPYERELSWNGWFYDYYVINSTDGSRKKVLERTASSVYLSPDERYVIYYKQQDSAWYSISIGDGKHTNLTKDLGVIFANEKHDTPDMPHSYGWAGWSKDQRHIFIRDRYDIWKLDVRGENKAVNLTKGFARDNHIRLGIRYVHHDQRYTDQFDKIYLHGFNEKTKQSGFYSYTFSTQEGPIPMLVSDHYYYGLEKAQNDDRIIWKRMSFKEYPELFTTEADFTVLRGLSSTNPQQQAYKWGTVEMTSWKAFDNTELEGLIYKPEDFDPNKKYPMIVYFYERYSDNLHYHYIPKPSHSTINFSEYVSNGYIVFVPDIVYKTGQPAQSAYNCIISGTRHMMQNAWVDSSKMALQGQSWGGYQTAMLVTQTNMFACAEAGAPVSNMTSAYGGIRWGAGISRAFQYEKGQSRIGSDLWKDRDLYIQNSPLFYADKVETPLLIMHNDKDGAVPWYQGIEYFCALRRLDKKVWMLTYNNDGHNLYKWPNRVDLSIRMKQFFDHYLKDEPMPVWMDTGVPAIKKGKETGYELVK